MNEAIRFSREKPESFHKLYDQKQCCGAGKNAPAPGCYYEAPLLKTQNHSLQFSKLHFLLKLVFKKKFPEQEVETGVGAGQDWTGSTTLIKRMDL